MRGLQVRIPAAEMTSANRQVRTQFLPSCRDRNEVCGLLAGWLKSQIKVRLGNVALQPVDRHGGGLKGFESTHHAQHQAERWSVCYATMRLDAIC